MLSTIDHAGTLLSLFTEDRPDWGAALTSPSPWAELGECGASTHHPMTTIFELRHRLWVTGTDQFAAHRVHMHMHGNDTGCRTDTQLVPSTDDLVNEFRDWLAEHTGELAEQVRTHHRGSVGAARCTSHSIDPARVAVTLGERPARFFADRVAPRGLRPNFRAFPNAGTGQVPACVTGEFGRTLDGLTVAVRS